MRKNWDEYFMNITDAVGLRATCDRGRSGAIIVKDNKILATGYAGSPPGLPHCDEVGHRLITVIENGITSEHCIRTIHSEVNAMLQAAEFGIKIKGGTLYCKMLPCYNCGMDIIRVGIIRVVAKRHYQKEQETIKMFRQSNIEFVILEDEIQKYE